MMPPISVERIDETDQRKTCQPERFLVSRQHSTHTLIERTHLLLHFENHGLESGAVEDATSLSSEFATIRRLLNARLSQAKT